MFLSGWCFFYLLCMEWESTLHIKLQQKLFRIEVFFRTKNKFYFFSNEWKKDVNIFVVFLTTISQIGFCHRSTLNRATKNKHSNAHRPDDGLRPNIWLKIVLGIEENWQVFSQNAKRPLSPRIQMQRFRLNQKQWFFDCIFHWNMLECWPFLNLNRRYWLRANNRLHCIIDRTKNKCVTSVDWPVFA